jgi:hypothetical protein
LHKVGVRTKQSRLLLAVSDVALVPRREIYFRSLMPFDMQPCVEALSKYSFGSMVNRAEDSDVGNLRVNSANEYSLNNPDLVDANIIYSDYVSMGRLSTGEHDVSVSSPMRACYSHAGSWRIR